MLSRWSHFARQNALYENHVNGDVALAQWQYFLATGDRAWFERYGYAVISDTADFWTSRVTYNREKDRYEIGKVVSVKESLIGVNNDPYTNAAAKKNLDLEFYGVLTPLGATVRSILKVFILVAGGHRTSACPNPACWLTPR